MIYKCLLLNSSSYYRQYSINGKTVKIASCGLHGDIVSWLWGVRKGDFDHTLLRQINPSPILLNFSKLRGPGPLLSKLPVIR